MLSRGIFSVRLVSVTACGPAVCLATIGYLRSSRLVLFPAEVLIEVADPSGARIAPKREDVLGLADIGVLSDVSDAKGDVIQLFVRKTPGRSEPTRIFIPILLRPLVMEYCHSDVSRTLHMLERFHWWIRMEQCVRW